MSDTTNSKQTESTRTTKITRSIGTHVIKETETTVVNKPEKSWFKKFAQENPLKVVWVALLSVGGLLLLIFFSSNRFLPDVKLEDASAMLVSVGLISVFVIVTLGLTLALPAFLLRHLHELNWISLDRQYLPFFTALLTSVCSFQAIVSGSSYSLVLYAIILCIALTIKIIRWKQKESTEPGCGPQCHGKIKLFLFFQKNADFLVEFFILTTIWLISFAPTLIPIYYLVTVKDFSSLCFVFFLIFLTFSINAFWAISSKKFSWNTLPVLALFIVSMLMMATDLPLNLPRVGARLLLISSPRGSVVAVVKKDACETIRSITNSKCACQTGEGGAIGFVSDIEIVSRIGSEVLLRYADKTDIILPKSDIVMWTRPAPTPTPTPADSASSASKVESIKTPVVCANNKASSPAPIASSPVTANTIVINKGNQTTQVQISAELKAELINTIQTSIKNEIKNIHKHAPKKTKPSACTPATKSTCVPLQCQVAAQCAEQHPPLTQ